MDTMGTNFKRYRRNLRRLKHVCMCILVLCALEIGFALYLLRQRIQFPHDGSILLAGLMLVVLLYCKGVALCVSLLRSLKCPYCHKVVAGKFFSHEITMKIMKRERICCQHCNMLIDTR